MARDFKELRIDGESAFPGPIGTGDARALTGGFGRRLGYGRGEIKTDDFCEAQINTEGHSHADGIGRAIGQGAA